MTIVAVLVLAVLLPPVLYDLLFSTNVRRLGLRNVVRRRSEAAMVVAGSMLATALITASMVVGDSFGQSVRDLAHDGWGPIDEVVVVDEADELDVTASAVAATEAAIDGSMPVRYVDVAVGALGNAAPVDPSVRVVEADLASLADFGGDPAATGFDDVPPLGSREVVVNSRVARELSLVEGDELHLYLAGERATFEVGAVVDAAGMAGFMEIVAPPGTLTVADLGLEGVRSVVLVSNVGDVIDGASRTESVVGALEASLGSDVDIDAVKADLLEAADEEAAETTNLFGTIGGFSVVAGVLLVINLFVMLAEERKSELGVLRAVGVKRAEIVRAFGLEGAAYGLVAAGLGALGGIAVGAAVVQVAERALAGDDDPAIGLSVVGTSILAGGVIGLAISQLTVVIASVRLSRLNIVAALKDLGVDSRGSDRRRRTTVVGLSAMVVGVLGWLAAPESQPVVMTAPVCVVLGAIPVLSRFAPGRVVTAVCSGLALAWPALVFSVLPEVMDDVEVSLFLLQGVLLVGLAAVFVGALAPVWLALAGRLGGKGLAGRLGLAYPLARPGRTGLLVAMYSLVIFTVTFMAVMNSVFQQSKPTMAFQAGGGYDLVVDAGPASGFETTELAERDDVAVAVPVATGELEVVIDPAVDRGAGSSTGDAQAIVGHRVSFVPAGFDRVELPELVARADEFADDDAAWAAVVNGSSAGYWVAVPDWSSLEVGSVLTLLAADGGEVRARVAGHTDLQWLVDGGVLASGDLGTALGHAAPTTRHYVQAAIGADPEKLASDLESAHVERGLQATTFLGAAGSVLDEQQTFLRILQGYLGLGLLIGIAGLGVVLTRAVRERRREIAMMRAVGFDGSTVRSAFLVEAAFIGLQGVLLGIGLGVLSAWQTLVQSTAFEANLEFSLPIGALVGLTVVCLVASLAAALTPAVRSARIAPAVALRL